MNRFTEPSTWAGFAAMAQAFAMFLPPQYQWIAHVVTAATGSAAVTLREQGNR